METSPQNLEKRVRLFEGKDFIPLFGVLNLISREEKLEHLRYSVAAGVCITYNTAVLTGLLFISAYYFK